MTSDPRSHRRYQKARALILAGNPPCWRCGAPATTADHIVEIALGGDPYATWNMRPACGPCNYGRGARLKAQLARVRKVAATPSRAW